MEETCSCTSDPSYPFLFSLVGKVEGEQGVAIHIVLIDANTGCAVTSGPKSSMKLDVTIPESDYRVGWVLELMEEKAEEVGKVVTRSKMDDLKLKIKIGNPSLRRSISGAIARAVSRSAVAPLETMKTHLMLGAMGTP